MQYKRSIIIINKKFQLKFAFFVCTWIFALSMIYPIIIYNIFEFFTKALSQGQTAQLTPEKIKDLQTQMIIVLGVLQLIFLAITFIITIFVSHRIAGPLYKLKKSMDEVAKGNRDIRITFRKNDHFKELQDSFNEMVQSLAEKDKKQN
jgi:nitrogen fixation/metabolism regulation signal transduction histidine kinase